jgi:queuine tRNA-ribosyltransferase
MNVTEEGVVFRSHVDQKEIIMKPEDSIHLQNQIGSDIMMALDDVISTVTTGPRVKEACERSVRWLDRCISAHKFPEKQNLFGIIQGSIYPDLRKYCLTEMIKRDCPGYAIGGLAGGENKEDFWKTVSLCTDYLPKDKPRYLMGVGYPVDLVVCACLGVDMFDCVFATRTARFGTGFTRKGFIRIKNKNMEFDFSPIDEDCKCDTCKSYTRSMLNKSLNNNDTALMLISHHNVFYLLSLMTEVRQSILDGKLPQFVNAFINKYFEREGWIPAWVIRALKEAQIEITTKLDIKELVKEDED